ncbi:hypothetical protein SRB5_14470 [Streptomyces sp. RB5]|uniref:DUF4383 domain-containing protein n=1 Tax=Streptomyces smaragdinus TaxID=2585196 RepID=A0A7K0CE41_9ACTN|nr:DUF4383 domain-containing protein [Streptomyces smaragdinus]MQY11332.1 hypothetical protein [Streptomyces smaragdinus]
MPTQDYPADSLPHPLAEPPHFEQEGPRGALRERGVNLGLRKHTLLDEALPVDHKLSLVYRIGAGLAGLWLIAFGILGLTGEVGFASKHGDEMMGLSTNGLLGLISVVAGAILLLGVIKGGNFASMLNMVMGGLFLLSGFVNLALLNTEANFLAFKMSNVIFSFCVGLFLLMCGMYGRVSSKLPHDNPYWRTRHTEDTRRHGLRTV